MAIFGIVILTALMNYWLIIAVIVLAIFSLFLQKVYLATSRNVKRLEGISTKQYFCLKNTIIFFS